MRILLQDICYSVRLLRKKALYSAVVRSHEIGIRMAMGASLEDIWKMVLAQNFAQVIIGLVRWSRGLDRFHARFAGPPVRCAARRSAHVCRVAGALALAALVASLVPAQRAARIDPVLALRND
jgi:putative ABC transport system permease protein